MEKPSAVITKQCDGCRGDHWPLIMATDHSDEFSQDPDLVSLFGPFNKPQYRMFLLNLNNFYRHYRIMY